MHDPNIIVPSTKRKTATFNGALQASGAHLSAEVIRRRNMEPNPAGFTGILSSAEFALSSSMTRTYLIDRVLVAGSIYGMTGMTGSGKTAVLLRMAAAIDRGKTIGGHETERGRVLYLAGENPDDVHARWLAQCKEMGMTPSDFEVHFVRGTFNLTDPTWGLEVIEAEARKLGGDFALVIVDTSTAYFAHTDHDQQWVWELCAPCYLDGTERHTRQRPSDLASFGLPTSSA